MRDRRVLIVTFAILAFVAGVPALDFPNPPDGFHWEQIDEIKGGVLMPEGWSFASEKGDGTLAYFVTKEPFDPYKKFLTGMTLNVFAGNPSAAARLRDAIDAEAKLRGVDVEAGSFGPFKTLQIRLDLPATAEHPKIKIVRVAITNPKTGTAYYCWFESPVDDWERTWPKGHTIISNLALNAKF